MGVDDSKQQDHARQVVLGKSITRPPKARARHLEPVPALPVRTLIFAAVATLACSYAVLRHYTRAREVAPQMRELPAPELIEVEK